MSYGNHQILCNSISSDSELNINIGKLPRENEERRRHRSKEKRDASHFKLQTDFVCAGGEEGDTGFGAQLLETGSIRCHIYQPGWFILKCLPGRAGICLQMKGILLGCCVVRLTVRVVTACRGAEPGFDWSARGSLCLTSCFGQLTAQLHSPPVGSCCLLKQ